MEAEPTIGIETAPDSRLVRLREEAMGRALECHPPPPPNAPEAVQRGWRAQVAGYSHHLLAAWTDPDRTRRLLADGERLRRESMNRDAIEAAELESEVSTTNEVRSVTIAELLQLKIPEREYLLDPWLREKEVAMVHAWRGIGKTHVGLNVAYAIASGGSFLNWRSPRPRAVLYIDGEMPARTMQERLAAIIHASAEEAAPSNLRFICADLHDMPLPSLSTAAGQQAIEQEVEAADVVVIDSLSTLASHGRENESESWLPMQGWVLSLRRRGKSVLLFHHDGKGGQQRGTSRKEDILDVVIGLRRPSDYKPQEGARFEVHFEKTRSLSGPKVEAFEAALDMADGRAVWTTRKLEDAELARAAALFRDGCTPKDVMLEMNISRAKAYRLKVRAAEQGLLSEPSHRLNP